MTRRAVANTRYKANSRPKGAALAGCALFVGWLLLIQSTPVAAQVIKPLEACVFPVVHVEAGQARNTAREAFSAFEAHRDDAFESATCIQRYREFLRDAAHAQKAAGAGNPGAISQFQQQELEVRLKLFDDLNDTQLPPASLAIYRNNLRRLRDLYQFRQDGKAFLDDIIAVDVNFNAFGSRLAEVREGVRKAIYSCHKWNFSHAANVQNMRPQWKDSCETEFLSLADSIPQFAQIAPVAARFAKETAPQPAEPAPSADQPSAPDEEPRR